MKRNQTTGWIQKVIWWALFILYIVGIGYLEKVAYWQMDPRSYLWIKLAEALLLGVLLGMLLRLSGVGKLDSSLYGLVLLPMGVILFLLPLQQIVRFPLPEIVQSSLVSLNTGYLPAIIVGLLLPLYFGNGKNRRR